MTAGTASQPGFITVVVLSLAGCVGLLGILIVTSRVLRQWREHRWAALNALARTWLLELATGDDARVAGARSRIAALDRRQWKALEPTVVSLLAKVKGELRSSLVSLFDERGTTAHALHRLRSGGRFRQVRRARAAALLGSLGTQDAWAPLCAALEDRSLAVRIAAARALGQVGVAGAARPLLGKLAGSRRVPSDIVAYALIQLGPGAQRDLVQAVGHEEPLVRAVAVEILGRTGAVSAVQALVAALQGDRSEEVRIRAARAIGRLGTPAGVAPLLAITDAGEPTALRVAAVAALGDLGAGTATPRLERLLHDPAYHVAHNAAGSLLRLGPAGEAALTRAVTGGEIQAAAHAMEVLAIASVEAARRPRARTRQPARRRKEMHR
jgi:HEAT repeat protein